MATGVRPAGGWWGWAFELRAAYGSVSDGVHRAAALDLGIVRSGCRLAACHRWLPLRFAPCARLRQKVVAVGRRAAVGEEPANASGVAGGTVVADVVDGELAECAVETARTEGRLVLRVACAGGVGGGGSDRYTRRHATSAPGWVARNPTGNSSGHAHAQSDSYWYGRSSGSIAAQLGQPPPPLRVLVLHWSRAACRTIHAVNVPPVLAGSVASCPT